MPGAAQYMQLGPRTFEVNVAVTGGQVVEVDAATAKIKPATANSGKVLGVALADANPAGSDPVNPIQMGAWARPEVAVARGPAEVYVTYTGAATFGDLLISAANGQVSVVPAVTTPAAATAGTATDISNGRNIIGRCTEIGGVLSGAVGLMKLYV